MRVKISENKLLLWLIQIVLIINPLSHFFVNVLGVGNVYYVGYVCWILLFGFNILVFRKKMMKKEFLVAILLLFSFFIGTFTGMFSFKDALYEFHAAVFICLAYISMVGANCNTKLNRKEILKLLNIVVYIGLLTCVYAIMIQGNYALQVLRKANVGMNAWKYTSFFSQRNIYGEYCFLSSVATLYAYAETKKKRYIGIMGLLGIQIYITNSRAALICFILLAGLYVYFSSKNKIVLVAALLILFVVFDQMFGIIDMVMERMTHTASSGIDSGLLRIMMWQGAFKKLVNDNALIFGFGQGTADDFLYAYYKFGSFHNVYVDAIFTGGIIYVLVIIRAIVMSFKKIFSVSEREFTNVFLAGLIGFTVYGLVESGMALFCANFFSITATIMFIYIPRIYMENNSG